MSDTSTVDALTAMAGDQRGPAWDLLVSRHGPDVWRLIRSRIGDQHAAEDAYQEFWCRLPRLAARFTPGPGGEPSARAWLMRIAYTQALNHKRDRAAGQRRAATLLGEPESHAMDQPADAIDHAELLERLRASLEELPERYRRPVLLRLLGGLSYEDLATDLRCSVNHARVQVHRGLQRLRKRMAADEDGLPTGTIAALLLAPLPPPPPPPALPALSAPSLASTSVLPKALLLTGLGAVGVAVAGTLVFASVESDAPPGPAAVPDSRATTEPDEVAARPLLLDDFERASTAMNPNGDGIVGDIGMVPAPGGSGRALRLAWPAAHGRWVDCGYQAARPLPEAVDEGAFTLSLSLATDDGPAIRYLAVRLLDAAGQTFEWRSGPLQAAESDGWRRLQIRIDPKRPAERWGGGGQPGQVVPRLALLGFAVAFTGVDAPAGSVLIDDVAIVAAEEP